MKLIRAWGGLLAGWMIAILLAGCASPIEVTVSDAAAFQNHDIIFVSIDDGWVANHSVIGLIQQELQRRGYAVRRGLPPAELLSRSMVLKVDHAGMNREPGVGRIDELRYLDTRLLEGSTGRLLARASYDDEDLDIIEQKYMVSEMMDELFEGS